MSTAIRTSSRDPSAEPAPPTTSVYGAPRLSLKEWSVVGIAGSLMVLVLPWILHNRPRTQVPQNYRIPYTHSEDYWLANEAAAERVDRPSIAFLGDSVIWGEFVLPDETWTACLARSLPATDFLNVGINGMHPLAMQGLVQYHLTSLRHRHVLVHCNLLWLSSPERDLSAVETSGFNHATLVPQFVPSIPAYHAEVQERIAISTRNLFPMVSLSRHIQLTGFDGQDIPRWTLEHPHESLFNRLSRLSAAPAPQNALRHRAFTWEQQHIRPQDFAWVALTASRQWQGLRMALDGLRARDNRVLVVLGPFNEHLLTSASRIRFQHIKSAALAWFRQHNVAVIDLPLLPTDEYADASHPLAAGYQRLADATIASSQFQEFYRHSAFP